MSKKLVVLNATPLEIDQMIRAKPERLVGIRLALIKLVANGATLRDVSADLPFITHSRVGVWVNRFNLYGEDGLNNKPKKGRTSLLSDIQCIEIKSIIIEKLPSDFGFNTATWTGPIIIELINKHYGVLLKKATIYVLLKKRLGMRHLKGKGIYPEAASQAREETIDGIKKTLVNRV